MRAENKKLTEKAILRHAPLMQKPTEGNFVSYIDRELIRVEKTADNSNLVIYQFDGN